MNQKILTKKKVISKISVTSNFNFLFSNYTWLHRKRSRHVCSYLNAFVMKNPHYSENLNLFKLLKKLESFCCT